MFPKASKNFVIYKSVAMFNALLYAVIIFIYSVSWVLLVFTASIDFFSPALKENSTW